MGGSCLHKGHGLVAICVFRNPVCRHIFSFWTSSPLAKSNAQDYAENSQSTTSSFSICRQSNPSPPSKTAAPVTLFGRARLGLNGSYFKHEEKEPILPDENAVIRCSDELEVISLKKEEVVVEAGKTSAVSETVDMRSKESLMHTETENCIVESAAMLRGLFIFAGEPVSTRHWCGCGCGVRVGFGQSDPDTLTEAEKRFGEEKISFRRRKEDKAWKSTENRRKKRKSVSGSGDAT